MRVVRGEGASDGAQRVAEEAIDLRGEGFAPETLRNAITGDVETHLIVDCPTPSRWWPALAVPTDKVPPLDRLVAAARCRGIRVPEERALAAAERELAALTTERVDPAETRRRLAEAGANVAELREEVAAARGRLEALRRVDGDTAAAESALTDAAERLSEAETERVAAEQAHEAAERQARRARSLRERRLRLQDRVANRRRDARRALIGALEAPFARAVTAVPGEARLSMDPLSVEGDSFTAALAAVRLADLRAPVVDATDRFDSAAAAANALGVPVLRC